MVLEKLSQSLRDLIAKLRGKKIIDKKEIKLFCEDLKKILIKSDVSYQLATQLSEEVQTHAESKTLLGSLTPHELLVNSLYEVMIKYLGEDSSEIKLKNKPTRLMLLGLYGSGKTTLAGKLALYYQKRGFKVALIQTDNFRPAAKEQLQTLGKQANSDFFDATNHANITKLLPTLSKYDLAIFDTAGRDAINKELLDEIQKLNKLIQPDEKVLVISADLGQESQNLVKNFQEQLGITSVAITKLDGSAKAGGALLASVRTGAKIKFVGVGEKIADLELFKPKNFVSQLFGLGDLETLLEKVQVEVDKEKAKNITERFMEGEFNLNDLTEQINQLSKLGPLQGLINMIPGLGSSVPKELFENQESKFKEWKVMINSMTPKERENPQLFDNQRILRVCKGSGKSEEGVRELLRDFKKFKKVSKIAKNPKQMQQILKRMGGAGGLAGLGM